MATATLRTLAPAALSSSLAGKQLKSSGAVPFVAARRSVAARASLEKVAIDCGGLLNPR